MISRPLSDIAVTIIKLTFPIIIPLIFSLGLLVYIRPLLNWEFLKDSRAFAVFILTLTFVLPLLVPFLVIFAGQNPVAYNEPFPVLIDYIYIAYFFRAIGHHWVNMG